MRKNCHPHQLKLKCSIETQGYHDFLLSKNANSLFNLYLKSEKHQVAITNMN